jgi:glycosyltransferase involved in cell wall biosynthesis
MSSSELPRSVLIVMPRWIRDGGVGAHMMRSAAALAETGVRVEVLVARVETDERIEGVEVIHSPQLFKTEEMAPRFAAALEREPEVIHLNQLDDPEVVSFLRGRAPVVLSAHSYLACASGVHYFRPGHGCTRAHGPGCVPNLLFRGCAHRFTKALPSDYRKAGRERAALRAADMTIGYSHAMDRHLRAAGVERRRVVPYFPTLDPLPGDGEQSRRVVFAGRLHASKGAATLLEAARELDAELRICGDGAELARLEELAARLGIAERVSFRGWLSPEGLAREFADAALVAVPSHWPEPFGLVGIEGFATGRPAVGSATGGIPEWLDDGVSGLTVPAGDAAKLAGALGELLGDPARRHAMGEAGRATVAARYSRAAHLDAVNDAYATARASWASSRPRPAAAPSR